MRFPLFTTSVVTLLLATIALPLIWWGPPLLVAFGAAAGLAALFLSTGVSSSALAALEAETTTSHAPAAATSSQPSRKATPHGKTKVIAAVVLALTALVIGIEDPVLSVKVALSSLLVSRALIALIPSTLGELARLAVAHCGALAAAALLVEPSGVLTCVLWQAVWLAVDFSRVAFITQPQASAESTDAHAAPAADANATQTDEGLSTIAEPDGITDPAPSSSSDPLPAAANDTAPESGSERHVATSPAAETSRRTRPLNLVQSASALAAALAITFLISIGIVQTIAPPPHQQTENLPEPNYDQLWNQSPWTDRQRATDVHREPPPVYGSREWACSQANTLDARGLNTLTAQPRADGKGHTGDWTPAVEHLNTPPLTPASRQAANRVFGASCPDAPNVRILAATQVRAAPGYRAQASEAEILVIGAVYALDLPDGRQLLLARGWSDNGDPAPSHLLMAWAAQNEDTQPPTVWLVSSKGSMGVAGVLFMPADQPLGGYQLWYGAMGADGALSASSADIIDVSSSEPRNTGAVPIWGASTCGQVPGDLLESAEPNCAEQPAWAFWLTDFQYSPGGADEVMLTWRVRRQFGEAGEPATYEEAFEETMHARFVMSGGHWRFMDGEGTLIADQGFALALNDAEQQQ